MFHGGACCLVIPHRVEAEAMGQKPFSVVWGGQLSSAEGKLSVHHSHRGELSTMMTSTCGRQPEWAVHARDSNDVCDTEALVRVGPSIPLDGDVGNLAVGQTLVVVNAP